MELRQLTFLRFLAASGVVMFHLQRDLVSLRWASPLLGRGDAAVSFFFVLSGFILACVYAERPRTRPSDFYVARIARIGPLYWLALLATALFEIRQNVLDPRAFALNALLLQSWWPGFSQTLNTPGWSLSVEWFFYLCFPFLFPGLLRMSVRALATLGAAAWALSAVLHVSTMGLTGGSTDTPLADFAAYHPWTHFGTFLSGCCAGLIFHRRHDRLRRFASASMLVAFVAFMLLMFVPNPIVAYHHSGLLTPIFVAFLFGLGATPDGRLARALSSPLLVLLGEASYGIYILQEPVFLAFVSVTARSSHLRSGEPRLWVFYVLLVVAAIVCFKLVEMPLRRRIHAWHAKLVSAPRIASKREPARAPQAP